MSAKSDESVVAMHWFRKGLRLSDNAALRHALSLAKGKGQIYPVYIVDPNSYQLLKCSVNRARFLLECLQDLDKSLKECGSRLYVTTGDPVEILPQMWTQFGVTHITHEADETLEPYALQRDTAIKAAADEAGVKIIDFVSETLRPLGNKIGGYVANCGGNSNGVPSTMTSFQKLLSRIECGNIPQPLEAPTKKDFPEQLDRFEEEYLPLSHPCEMPWPRGVPRSEIGPVWNRKDADKVATHITKGGETYALEILEKKITARPEWSAAYEKPKTSCTEVSSPSTTGLSPYLANGCISPRTAWHAIADANKRAKNPPTKPPVSLHGQLLWRDFNNLMAHSANSQQPGSWGKIDNNPYCREIPWSSDSEMLAVWKEGRTGYPWIDACMAQLRTEGWIHHLGRHAVACFLTRGDLWQSWVDGASVFEGELLDADYALNNFNWMWLSCSGFFYMYFRCYSPVAFQKKNDPNGNYIRKWVPELATLPKKYIYEPWKANVSVLDNAGVKLGRNYPRRVVDHSVVSKENMSKMKIAYDLHKEKKGGGKKIASNSDVKGPAKKKAKKQTKLK